MRRASASGPVVYGVLSFLLSVGCSLGSLASGPPQTPVAELPSATPATAATSLSTATPSLETPVAPATPAEPLLASYFVTWADGVAELDACVLGYGQFSRVLYADGHLVMRAPDGYVEAWLSEGEVNALLSTIEQTGFFQVEGDGSEREHDSIYEVPEDYLPPDGLPYEEMTVLEKHVSIYAGLFEYLIPEVTNARDIFLDYAPPSVAPYSPSALEVLFYELPGPEGAYRPTPIPPTVDWPSALPPLRDRVVPGDVAQVMFGGDQVSTLMELFPRLPSSRIVREGGREYLMAACPVLP